LQKNLPTPYQKDINELLGKGEILMPNNWDMIRTLGDSKPFRFLHGIEIEYFLLDENYHPTNRKEKLEALIRNIFQKIKNDLKTNEKIRKKIKSIAFEDRDSLNARGNKDDAQKICTISVQYRQNKFNFTSKKIDIVGKDTHLGTGGFITLELVTPPCADVEELVWWLKTLQHTTLTACKELKLHFFPMASHPAVKDNYCGEHHHIGVPDKKNRLKIYNTIRYFLPILSVMSYTSFSPEIPENLDFRHGFNEIKMNNQVIRSIRLTNTSQIRPVPPINVFSLKKFAENCKVSIESCRMVDLYPFTKYESIEIRLFDTSISIARTIATAVLLQAISLYALDIDNKMMFLLNKIVTINFYKYFRQEIIKTGLITVQKARKMYMSLKSEIEHACSLCRNHKSCGKKKLPNLSCEFEAKNQIYHNLISLIVFPNRFKSKIHPEIPRINTKTLFELMLELLTPYLKKMELTQNLALKSFRASLNLKKEPSLYYFYHFKKSGPDINKFFKHCEEIQARIFNEKQSLGIYYDPLLKS